MSEWGVVGCLVLTLGFAVVYAAVNRYRYALSVALVIVACMMFTYSATLVNGGDAFAWFVAPPPWFVSRAVLVAIGTIILIGVFRVGWRKLSMCRATAVLVILALLVIPATVVSTAMCLPKCNVFPDRTMLAFAAILTAMLLLPIILIILELRLPQTADGKRLAVASMLILAAVVSLVGFLEVALDIGFVRNMFTPGIVETRASSTFQNPNWFALCLAPFLFTALALAVRNAQRSAYALTAFTTLGLLSAASRSVLTVMAIAITVFFVVGHFSRRATRAEMLRALRALVGGGAIGVASAMGMASLLGQVAVDRFATLLVRIVIWPRLIVKDSAVAESLFGRLYSPLSGEVAATGTNVVDSAYLFMWTSNPLTFIVLAAFLSWTGILVIRHWRLDPDITSSLNLSLFVFIVLVGFVGQAYWAFPVWIVLSVMLAWALRGVAPSMNSLAHP